MTKITLCIAILLLVGSISAQDHLWKFDENKGKIAYDSKGGPKGKNAVKGFLNNAYWRDLSKGGAGSAVRITGDDDSYVTFGTKVGQFCKEDFTVAFWVQTSDCLDLFDLVGNREAAGHGNFFSVRMGGDGYVTAEINEDSKGTNYIGVRSSCGGLNDGQWHHITVTRCGGELVLYIDGDFSNKGSSRGTANINNDNAFKIGRSMCEPGTCRFAPDALFDDLAIYSDALNGKEVKELYKCATNE